MAHVLMYKTEVCPYCKRAVELLASYGVLEEHIEVIYIDTDTEAREAMLKVTGRRTVPQIFINKKHVGGADDLIRLHNNGMLQALLDGKMDDREPND